MNFQDLTSFYLFCRKSTVGNAPCQFVIDDDDDDEDEHYGCLLAPMIFVRMDSFHHFGLYEHRTQRLSSTSV
jgi:hypothetical protein